MNVTIVETKGVWVSEDAAGRASLSQSVKVCG